MSFPISSRLVAAEATSNWSEAFARRASSKNTNSAIGDRQILPWQINRIFVISLLSFAYRDLSLIFNGFLVSLLLTQICRSWLFAAYLCLNE
jgi:hypothetical protein